jgi:hypothetical protein
VDYRLACQLGGTDDDNLIIRNLPLFLSDTTRAWLEHLPPAQISIWDDLVKAFAGNFQGTYVRPGNSWDLRSCRQQPGESLRDYIRWFSKKRTELPNITDSDVIGVFLAGTTCHDLVSKLGRKMPTRTSELMDIATKFASGQEAVEAILRKDKQPQGRQQEDVPEALKGKCALGPFLSILVIVCQHKCLNVNLCPWMNKVKITSKGMFLSLSTLVLCTNIFV